MDENFVRIVVGYADIQGVRQLLQFGDHIWITDPPEAVQITADLASELAKLKRPGFSSASFTPLC